MDEAIEQYRILHRASKEYGSTSERLLEYIVRDVVQLRPAAILDYGCGKSRLVDMLARIVGAQAYRYDPAIDRYAQLPVQSVDMVLNTDVLEHIPEPDLAGMLQGMSSLSPNAVICVCVVPALQVLPNGQNAHCTVREKEWWIELLGTVYPTVTLLPYKDERKFICRTF